MDAPHHEATNSRRRPNLAVKALGLVLVALLTAAVSHGFAQDAPSPQPVDEASGADGSRKTQTRANPAKEPLPPGMACVLAAYPEQVCSGRGGAEPAIVFCDGTEMPWDLDNPHEDHDHLLNHADLADQMSMQYVRGADYDIPDVDFEPGRVRYDPFFAKMYGNSKKEVAKHVVKIVWMPSTVKKKLRVTSINGVDEKLAAVSAELEKLPEDIRAIAAATSGTFVWREIRGTDRRSVHSYAIAIDVGVEHSDFWRWNKPDENGRYPYKNDIPLEIVEAFERHGFIWGGKWYHYDTMHFEYRPELLAEPCVGTKGSAK